KVNVNGNTTSYIQIYVASDEAEVEKISKVLENLKLDFGVSQKDIYISSSYFYGCENLISNLKTVNK
ncbi:MAG: hypothetical protein HFJ38_08520, partial [Bacilli bacterium]|nr:hypothetical protein [Bacilli bacterium]